MRGDSRDGPNMIMMYFYLCQKQNMSSCKNDICFCLLRLSSPCSIVYSVSTSQPFFSPPFLQIPSVQCCPFIEFVFLMKGETF